MHFYSLSLWVVSVLFFPPFFNLGFSIFQDNSGPYKNLLQELVQKEGFSLPVYDTNRSGEVHVPIFVSTVEIEGEVFKGHEGRTKKQAEMNAAKIAYTTLKERKCIFLSTLLVSGLVLTLSKPFSF